MALPQSNRERRTAAYESAKTILEKVEAENRPINEHERMAFDAHMSTIDACDMGRSRAREVEPTSAAFQRWSSTPLPQISPKDAHRPLGYESRNDPGYAPTRGSAPRILGYASDGRPVHAFGKDDRLADVHGGAQLSPGLAIRGILTGHWDGAGAERAAIVEGDDTKGGVLMSSPISSRLIDLARNRSVCVAAGASTIEMESGELSIVRITSDATASWRHEGTPIATSTPAFGKIVMRARTLGVLVPVSVEWMEDCPNFAGQVEDALSAAIATELDRACLRGSGATAEPQGVTETTGIGTIAVGTTPTYVHVSNAYELIEIANGQPNAWVMHPKERGTFRKKVDGEGNWLVPPPDIGELQRFVSNQLAQGTMVLGDFRQMLIGLRLGGVRLEVLREGYTSADNALTELKVFLRLYLRGDVAILRESHFTSLTGCTT